jgi:hypothetical protein
MTSVYTCAGSYKEYFKNLPDDIPELGRLICSQVIHRVTLREGNANANASLAYGDMTKFPWSHMRCEDDMLQTAAAMSEDDFKEIDYLAGLMVNPDENFDILCEIWNTHKKYRILNSPLVGDWDNGTEG